MFRADVLQLTAFSGINSFRTCLCHKLMGLSTPATTVKEIMINIAAVIIQEDCQIRVDGMLGMLKYPMVTHSSFRIIT